MTNEFVGAGFPRPRPIGEACCSAKESGVCSLISLETGRLGGKGFTPLLAGEGQGEVIVASDPPSVDIGRAIAGQGRQGLVRRILEKTLPLRKFAVGRPTACP